VERIEVTGAGTIEVDVGDEVVFRLRENATTGYVWTLTINGDALTLAGLDLRPPGADQGVGAAGERLFEVRAIAPGLGEVVLRLGRPWDRASVEERRVVVAVRG